MPTRKSSRGSVEDLKEQLRRKDELIGALSEKVKKYEVISSASFFGPFVVFYSIVTDGPLFDPVTRKSMATRNSER